MTAVILPFRRRGDHDFGVSLCGQPFGDERNPESPSNRGVNAGGKASSVAAPQGEATHAGTGSEMLAGCEGRSAGTRLIAPLVAATERDVRAVPPYSVSESSSSEAPRGVSSQDLTGSVSAEPVPFGWEDTLHFAFTGRMRPSGLEVAGDFVDQGGAQ